MKSTAPFTSSTTQVPSLGRQQVDADERAVDRARRGADATSHASTRRLRPARAARRARRSSAIRPAPRRAAPRRRPGRRRRRAAGRSRAARRASARARRSPRTTALVSSSASVRSIDVLVVAPDDVLSPRAEARLEDERRLELGRRQPRRDVHGARVRDAGARTEPARCASLSCAATSVRGPFSTVTPDAARRSSAQSPGSTPSSDRQDVEPAERDVARAAGVPSAWAGDSTVPSRVFVGRDTVGDDRKGAHSGHRRFRAPRL